MEQSELTDKAIGYILSHLEDEISKGQQYSKLTDWERGFIESVSEQWTRRQSLSEKQKEVLGRIWDKQS